MTLRPLALLITLFSCSFAFAQTGADPAAALPYLVAFVKIDQAIQEHPDFAQKQAILEQSMKRDENVFEEWNNRLEVKKKALAAMKPDSPEYKRIRPELTKELNDFEVAFKKRELELLREHVKMTYEIYQEIKSETAAWASQRNIAHVINMLPSQVNFADADSVDNEINKTTVWIDPRLNVTEYILGVCYQKRGKKYAGNDTSQKSGAIVPVSFQQQAPSVSAGEQR